MFKFVKTFEGDNIGSGSAYKDSWTADADYLIKRIFLIRKDGKAFTASTFYFKIGDRVFTREISPAIVFGPDIETSPEVNIKFSKGEKLDFTLTNKEGETISVFVCFEVHTPE